MSARSDDDLAVGNFGIGRRAWIVELVAIVLAGVALVAIPGPVATGCFVSKGCSVTPHAPFLVAVAVLAVGFAMSAWLGEVPRRSLVGWSAATAAITATVLVSLPLALARPMEATTWGLAGALTFGVVALAQLPLAWIATWLPSPSHRREVPTPPVHDDRPMWHREIATTLEALSSDRATRPSAAATQLVAELVFTLEADPEVPRAMQLHIDRLRSLLSRDVDDSSREALLIELRAAASLHGESPYRESRS